MALGSCACLQLEVQGTLLAAQTGRSMLSACEASRGCIPVGAPPVAARYRAQHPAHELANGLLQEACSNTSHQMATDGSTDAS